MIFGRKNNDSDISGLDSSNSSDYALIIHKLAFAAVTEQRRARRWRVFFISLFFVYVGFITTMVLTADSGAVMDESGDKFTALVKLEGVIASGEAAGSENINKGLKDAFKNPNTKAVILEMNSPGGSPVQSAYVYDEIIRLRDEYPDIQIYTVVTDIAASGGYFIAAATDEIYVNRSSLLGSIGVRMDSFGFVDLIEKIGVTRRLLTAGEHKGLADPFLPENPEQKEHLQIMLDQVHTHFIESVQNGRGERLADNEDLYTGLIWSGEQAIELGLADGFGSSQSIARDLVGAEKLVDFTPKGELLDRIANRIGSYLKLQFSDYPSYRF